MQQLRNTSFIFTGSRRRIIYDMLNNSSRPLYKFCQPIEFPAFGPALSSAIKSLKDKEILDEEGAGKGTVVFDDPLFAIWLKTSFD